MMNFTERKDLLISDMRESIASIINDHGVVGEDKSTKVLKIENAFKNGLIPNLLFIEISVDELVVEGGSKFEYDEIPVSNLCRLVDRLEELYKG